MIYKKYEFPNQELLAEKVEAIDNANEPIVLNKLQLKPAIRDGFEIITEAVLSQGWCVDMVWNKDIPEDWNEYEIYPTNPKHKILEI